MTSTVRLGLHQHSGCCMTRRVDSIIASSYAVIEADIRGLSIVTNLEGNPFLDRLAPIPVESIGSPTIEHMSSHFCGKARP